MKQPNIVQIVVDDMGLGDLSFANGGLSSTPTLDQLAAEGMCLNQHYCGSPVCAPARAALLTGRYPHRTGAIDTMELRGLDRISRGERTLADELGSAGYATGLVGKWHNGAFDRAFHPRERGFQEFVGFQGGWQDYWEWTIEVSGAQRASDGRHLTEVFTEEALGFVRRHSDKPFYLHLAYNAPHFPLQAPEALIERFVAHGAPSRAVATIYAMMSMVDDGVGCVLQLLDDLRLTQNTIVMFTSDNGPDMHGEGEDSTHRFNEGLRGSKTFVFEGGIKVPMIVRWPAGIPRGTQNDSLVHFVDWVPTLLEAAGITPSGNPLDGISRLDVLRGENVPSPARFWQWTRYTPLATSNSAMREGDYKLIYPDAPGTLEATADDLRRDAEIKKNPPTEIDKSPYPEFVEPTTAAPLLFNLATDPHETANLAEIEPQRARAMSDALHDWFDDVESTRRAHASF